MFTAVALLSLALGIGVDLLAAGPSDVPVAPGTRSGAAGGLPPGVHAARHGDQRQSRDGFFLSALQGRARPRGHAGGSDCPRRRRRQPVLQRPHRTRLRAVGLGQLFPGSGRAGRSRTPVHARGRGRAGLEPGRGVELRGLANQLRREGFDPEPEGGRERAADGGDRRIAAGIPWRTGGRAARDLRAAKYDAAGLAAHEPLPARPERALAEHLRPAEARDDAPPGGGRPRHRVPSHHRGGAGPNRPIAQRAAARAVPCPTHPASRSRAGHQPAAHSMADSAFRVDGDGRAGAIDRLRQPGRPARGPRRRPAEGDGYPSSPWRRALAHCPPTAARERRAFDRRRGVGPAGGLLDDPRPAPAGGGRGLALVRHRLPVARLRDGSVARDRPGLRTDSRAAGDAPRSGARAEGDGGERGGRAGTSPLPPHSGGRADRAFAVAAGGCRIVYAQLVQPAARESRFPG